MENEVIYSDEQETFFVRLSDVKPVIEEFVGLPVAQLKVARDRVDLESPSTVLRFPEKRPDALWWFLVIFDSPEGLRKTMVQVALEGQALRGIVLDEPPQLQFFSEALRLQAKEGIPDLTREYIEQLEEVAKYGQMLWKNVNEYAKEMPGFRDDLYLFFRECRKLGFLLPDADDGGPQGLGYRKLYLPSWRSGEGKSSYITGDEEP